MSARRGSLGGRLYTRGGCGSAVTADPRHHYNANYEFQLSSEVPPIPPVRLKQMMYFYNHPECVGRSKDFIRYIPKKVFQTTSSQSRIEWGLYAQDGFSFCAFMWALFF